MQNPQYIIMSKEGTREQEGSYLDVLEKGMSAKKYLNHGIKIIVECDANPTTIIVRTSKKQILRLLDWLLPDDPEPAKQ